MASSESPVPETVIEGRLVADPELRHTNATGKPVTNIRVAVNTDDGTEYHNVVVWGRTAEVVCEFLRKGRSVQVFGRIQEREYQPEEGEARTVTEIVARSVQFLGRRPRVETEEQAA